MEKSIKKKTLSLAPESDSKMRSGLRSNTVIERDEGLDENDLKKKRVKKANHKKRSVRKTDTSNNESGAPPTKGKDFSFLLKNKYKNKKKKNNKKQKKMLTFKINKPDEKEQEEEIKVNQDNDTNANENEGNANEDMKNDDGEEESNSILTNRINEPSSSIGQGKIGGKGR